MAARQWLLSFIVGLGAVSSVSCNGLDTTDLQGAGATFPAPLYKRWFLEYYQQHPNVRVNYQATGSGAGVRQFSSDLLDFGASDGAMSDKEIASAVKANPRHEGVLMLPVTAGIISLCYNVPDIHKVPGAPEDLRLSRKVYSDIFLGKIANWNDPAIAALNPLVRLPDLPITIVRRADGSGTTFAFTNHMSAVSTEWKERVGVGKSVVWPTGIGGKGNAGVAALIQQTPGALGYLELGYAELLHIPMARLENKDGQYVAPSIKGGQFGLASAKLPDNLRVFVPDPSGPASYPIVTYTWMLCWKNYGASAKKAATLKAVLRYCLTDGQKISEELGYIPLPLEVTERVLKAVDTIQP
ncbi:MAG: phosphate ABC transporter substrate-binding protein PstS [Gemmataceae bacterium]|nr:phosphate ABC transporter substrate-binding protein PstS [Gemmataceae bacterium]